MSDVANDLVLVSSALRACIEDGQRVAVISGNVARLEAAVRAWERERPMSVRWVKPSRRLFHSQIRKVSYHHDMVVVVLPEVFVNLATYVSSNAYDTLFVLLGTEANHRALTWLRRFRGGCHVSSLSQL